MTKTERQQRRKFHAHLRRVSNPVQVFDENNPRKSRRAWCRYLVNRAVKFGILQRPDYCEECGCECRPCAHHTDETKPLVPQWLCYKCCHAKRRKPKPHHRRYLTAEQYDQIHQLLAAGELSQAAIARRVGCSDATIIKIKRGQQRRQRGSTASGGDT